MFTNYPYLIYIFKQDLALNNLQYLMCHKIQPNKSKQYNYLEKTIDFNTK